MSIDCEVCVVDTGARSVRRVRITGEDDDTVPMLVEKLGGLASRGGDLFLNGARLPRAGTLGLLGLTDGATISIGRPVPGPRQVASTGLRLHIVGGPGAGASFALKPGTTSIGRGETADLPLADPDVSRVHAEVQLAADGSATVKDLGSTNGTRLEGVIVTKEGTPLPPGALFQVGSTLLAVQPTDVEPLMLVPRDGHLGVNRRFRPAARSWPEEVPFPLEREGGDPPAAHLLLTLAPGVAMALIAVVTGRLEFLLFSAVAPLIGVARAVSQRRSWKKGKAADRDKYRNDLVAAEARLEAAVGEERSSRRSAAPHLGDLALHARLPGRRLWERQPADEDFLDLRMGMATQPSTIKVTGVDAPVPPIWRLPVTVGLRTARNLSLVGPRADIRAVARSLLLQLAVRESPANVKLCVIADADAEATWGWVAWLPHCRWAEDEPYVLVGSDTASTRSRLNELRDLIKHRAAERAADRRASLLPAVVVVLDDAARLLQSGFSEILRDGPAVGVHAICLDEAQVPEHCLASLDVHDGHLDQGRLDQQQRQPLEELVVDAPARSFCDTVARALAPLRGLGDQGGARDLPANLRLVELLGLADLTPEAVLARWAASSPSSAAVVGLTTDGPLELDLTRDGPHGLVAGTTRSGKSEFMKTFVAAFALTNHPDDLQFLFIDFKNSGDYRLAARLPHAIDLSTSEDLDVFERTLRLLEAEIDRRRRRFDEAQATTIEGYRTARARQPTLEPIGRIVVLADEFAQLVMKAQDQLDKLVTVAQTGAAFGIHLLLATQRPQGAVTGQIDANVALRVCFRVEKSEESAAVIDASEAGEIAQHHAGRAFARTHGEPLFELQSARVGGARPGSTVGRKELALAVRLWSELGRVPSAPPRVEVPDPETDLWDIVEAVVSAAALSGWTGSAVPWPRPLPSRITLDALPPPADDALIPFAVVDDPAGQSRVAGGLRLGQGHLSVTGSGGTGRTTALRTLACSIALRMSAADAHIYVMDFAGGRLRPLGDLPHCGGTAFDDWDQATRIVGALQDIVNARSESFSTNGHANLDHQRSSGDAPLPYLFLLIDGWQVLAEEGARYGLPDQIAQLLSKGQSVGLQAAVAGDRTVAVGRMGRLLASRYVLRFNEPNDYATAGLGYREIPSQPVEGRAVIVGSAMEAQIAQVGAEQTGEDAATRRLVEQVAQRDAGIRSRWPRRLEPLPKRLSLAELRERGGPPPDMAVPVLLGLSGETSLPVYVDLGKANPSAFIAGLTKSGRTNALLAIAHELLDRQIAVAVVNPCGSRLSELTGRAGVTSVLEGAAARQVDVAALARAARIVLVDDADQLDPTFPAHVTMASGEAGVALVAAVSADTLLVGGSLGWIATLKRSRTGLLFSPRTKYDGALFGGTLPDHMVFQGPLGRAVVGLGGRIDVVQLPKV